MDWFKTRHSWVLCLLALSMLSCSVSIASAQPAAPQGMHRPRPRGIVGEVISIDKASLTLNTRRESVTVVMDDVTRFRIPGLVGPGLNDLEVGATVLVAGRFREDGRHYARLVAVLSEPKRPVRVIGQVREVKGNALTLTLRAGKIVTLTTDAETRFVVPGLRTAFISDINPGDTVAARGPRTKADEVPYAATVALVRDAAGTVGAIRGELVTINDSTLRIVPRTGHAIELQTDERTRFLVPGIDSADIESLSVSDRVGVRTVARDDGSIYASVVSVDRVRPRRQRGAVVGRIRTIGGQEVALATRQGLVTVRVNEHTRFRIPGIDEPGPGDLSKDYIIGAAGWWSGPGQLKAGVVVARSRRQ